MKTFIAYYRVSTNMQGRSGLGIEAQIADVKRFIGDNTLLAEFTEVESGSRNDRPELDKALKLCKEKKATLVIAKLDRLSRSVLFIETLKSQGVSFVCCDMPEANELVLGMMAVIAQYERSMIIGRINKALKAKRARGEKWGGISPNHPANHLDNIRKKRGYSVVNPVVAELVKEGVNEGKSLARIATELNKAGHRTYEQKEFTAVQVMRLRDRIFNKQAA